MLFRSLALIQKIPTPITPVRMDKDHRQITLAYFDQRSTVDYIGAVQGIPVCFDAKECSMDTFPLHNIHEHQMNFMRDFEKQDGISFFLIYYSTKNLLYYMRFEEIEVFWERMKQGGRKSVRFEELDEEYFMQLRQAYSFRIWRCSRRIWITGKKDKKHGKEISRIELLSMQA